MHHLCKSTVLTSLLSRRLSSLAPPTSSFHLPYTTSRSMEALFFNSHSGYLEGVLRGFKAGLLTQAQYSNLTQCETLDGAFFPSL